jgi:hypothetical protein
MKLNSEWSWRGSNPRPCECHSHALPAAPQPQQLNNLADTDPAVNCVRVSIGKIAVDSPVIREQNEQTRLFRLHGCGLDFLSREMLPFRLT